MEFASTGQVHEEDSDVWERYEQLAGQLLKIVYFGQQDIYEVEMKDLLGDLEKYKPKMPAMGDDFMSLLGGGGGGNMGEDGEPGDEMELFK